MINVDMAARPTSTGWSAEKRVQGVDGMLKIIQSEVEKEMGALISTGATPRAVLEDSEKWRFRCRPGVRWNIGAIVGTMTEADLAESVRATMVDVKAHLTEEQPNGTWAVCAWEITQGYKAKRVRVPMTEAEYLARESGWNQFTGRPNPQKTAFGKVEDPYLVLTLAWVDVLQATEQDNWRERTGLPTSPMMRYLETGDLKFLPQSMRKQRDAALDLLQRYCDYWYPESASAGLGLEEEVGEWPEHPNPLPSFQELQDIAEQMQVDISDLGKKRKDIYWFLRGIALGE